MSIPRPEYPRPQLARDSFINLNGEWEFSVDHGRTGVERGLHEGGAFDQKIIVPFCPESALSGIGYVDFMDAVWYRRVFSLPKGWAKANRRTLLHFGAVDYLAQVYINGRSAGTHAGGYSSFSLDITDYLREGENTLCVYAQDLLRKGGQPRGKQSAEYRSHHCDYTRTTGIWQTVWLENVPGVYIKSLRFYPDIHACALDIQAEFSGFFQGEFAAEASFEGRACGGSKVSVKGRTARLRLELGEKHLWGCGQGNLYDLALTLGEDSVRSYFGLREVTWDGEAMLLNGERVFQRLVLDQGFYPEGIYTAPDDQALRRDIELAMRLGFNGARLHQKVFEPRFLYHADKLGYLVWGEHASWGLDISGGEGIRNFLPEWLEILKRDFNHPSIIGWCPFNETWDGKQRQDDAVLSTVYHATKAADPTRPVIDTSGNYHVITDIYDIHDYTQDTRVFAQHYAPMASGGEPYETYPARQSYGGGPYFVSEFGGARWSAKDSGGWGYGDAPRSPEEFAQRYESLTATLLDNPRICAFCYTQLYDIEQEQNGLFTYVREEKFFPEIYERIRRANTRPAKLSMNNCDCSSPGRT